MSASPTAGTPCEFYVDGRRCGRPSVGYLRWWRREPWPMCDVHIDPSCHPADLHDHLRRTA